MNAEQLIRDLTALADDLDYRRELAADGRPPAEQSREDRLWANYMYGQSSAFRSVIRLLESA